MNFITLLEPFAVDKYQESLKKTCKWIDSCVDFLCYNNVRHYIRFICYFVEFGFCPTCVVLSVTTLAWISMFVFSTFQASVIISWSINQMKVRSNTRPNVHLHVQYDFAARPWNPCCSMRSPHCTTCCSTRRAARWRCGWPAACRRWWPCCRGTMSSSLQSPPTASRSSLTATRRARSVVYLLFTVRWSSRKVLDRRHCPVKIAPVQYFTPCHWTEWMSSMICLNFSN